MALKLSPEEPSFSPWHVVPVQAVIGQLLEGVPSVVSRPLIVAIDGRSGSGKTTLAETIGRALPGAAVVHTDDIAWHHSFFDWTDLLLENVLEPVRAGQAVRYRPLAWQERGREGAIEVPASCSLLIVEGVGAARRELMHAVDKVIWIQSDLERRRKRGIARDGGDAAEAFWDEWTAEEVVFLKDQKPWERADLVVCGTPALSYDPSSHIAVAGKARGHD